MTLDCANETRTPSVSRAVWSNNAISLASLDLPVWHWRGQSFLMSCICIAQYPCPFFPTYLHCHAGICRAVQPAADGHEFPSPSALHFPQCYGFLETMLDCSCLLNQSWFLQHRLNYFLRKFHRHTGRHWFQAENIPAGNLKRKDVL